MFQILNNFICFLQLFVFLSAFFREIINFVLLLVCVLLGFSEGFIHFLFKDLYHHHIVGCNVFFLNFSCLGIFSACCGLIGGIWWRHILGSYWFLHWRLDISVWGSCRSRLWFLCFSLWVGDWSLFFVSSLEFRLPVCCFVYWPTWLVCSWKMLACVEGWGKKRSGKYRLLQR